MTRENEIKIQIKTGLSFCWITRSAASDLSYYAKKVKHTRARFLQEMACNHFGIWVENKEDLAKLDIELKSHKYKNRADWLRSTLRKMNEFEVDKLTEGGNCPKAAIEDKINEFLNAVKVYGHPSIYFQDFVLIGVVPVIKVERHPEYDWQMKLYISENNAFDLDLENGALIKTINPSHFEGYFHYCYMVRDSQREGVLCYIGRKADFPEKMKYERHKTLTV